MTSKKRITLHVLARELGLAVEVVRDVLKEAPGAISREVQDRVFKTARKLGYDFRKLRIGKRMEVRKETLEEVADKIESRPDWHRAEIVKYLRDSLKFIERVRDRILRDEFSGPSR